MRSDDAWRLPLVILWTMATEFHPCHMRETLRCSSVRRLVAQLKNGAAWVTGLRSLMIPLCHVTDRTIVLGFGAGLRLFVCDKSNYRHVQYTYFLHSVCVSRHECVVVILSYHACEWKLKIVSLRWQHCGCIGARREERNDATLFHSLFYDCQYLVDGAFQVSILEKAVWNKPLTEGL